MAGPAGEYFYKICKYYFKNLRLYFVDGGGAYDFRGLAGVAGIYCLFDIQFAVSGILIHSEFM